MDVSLFLAGIVGSGSFLNADEGPDHQPYSSNELLLIYLPLALFYTLTAAGGSTKPSSWAAASSLLLFTPAYIYLAINNVLPPIGVSVAYATLFYHY